MGTKINFITIIHNFIFSPTDFFIYTNSRKKNYRHSWLVFLSILCLFLGFYLAIFPTISSLINDSFRENDIEYTGDISHLILSITFVLGIIQFTSMVLISFFILHIIGILFGGTATAKTFFPSFVYSIMPIGLKFTILIVFTFFWDSDFAFSIIYPKTQMPLDIIMNIIYDPFFWWSTILGCVALKEIHQLSLKKSMTIISITISLGIISLLTTSLFF
ncbi:YIP1 family protein [Bacillus sp. NPDC077027]|uniref:YIP1 family protein n=1 Tax=Bacillus sp. NPDC077027 TaxID=3390548 RepID=UPI003D061CCC